VKSFAAGAGSRAIFRWSPRVRHCRQATGRRRHPQYRGAGRKSGSSRNRGRRPLRDLSTTKSRACGSRSSVAAPKMHLPGATGATRTPRTAMGAVQLHGPRREFVPALLLCSRLNRAPVPGTIRASGASDPARGKTGPQMCRLRAEPGVRCPRRQATAGWRGLRILTVPGGASFPIRLRHSSQQA